MGRNVYLRNLNLVDPEPSDDRRIEVLATGLHSFLGSQVAVDCALVSPLHRNGRARPQAAHRDGIALEDIAHDKRVRYPEFANSSRCRLVVAAMEVGGRWSEEAYQFLVQLALGRARGVPAVLRTACALGFMRRWATQVSMAAMRAFAQTLLHGERMQAEQWDGDAPALSELLRDHRLELPGIPSRLPGGS